MARVECSVFMSIYSMPKDCGLWLHMFLSVYCMPKDCGFAAVYERYSAFILGSCTCNGSSKTIKS